MGAFEGLRLLRVHISRRPNEKVERLIELIVATEPASKSYDLDAALFLNQILPVETPHSDIAFYRACVAHVILRELPSWAKLMTLGRGRFIKRLQAEEFRDIRSLFRQAHLLEEPPGAGDVEWWDNIQAQVRFSNDAEKLVRGREGERLTLKYEKKRLEGLGITNDPKWTAIEDNTAGYDVLSYNQGPSEPVNKLIEVKSTIASPLRFYLSRNEWDKALKYGNSYYFHVWNISGNSPILHEKTLIDIKPHVPLDSGDGKWSTCIIPITV